MGKFLGVDSGYDADENRGPAPLKAKENKPCDEFWNSDSDIPMASIQTPTDFFRNNTSYRPSQATINAEISSSAGKLKTVVGGW